MLNTTITLDGNRIVELRMQRLESRLWDRLGAEVQTLTGELLQHVLAAEPSLSGRLRAQTRMRFRETDQRISGSIRPATSRKDAAKAAALEYGAHGTVAVRSYERASGIVVDTYERHVNIAAQRFLRDPFSEMQPEIKSRLELVSAQLIAEANGGE